MRRNGSVEKNSQDTGLWVCEVLAGCGCVCVCVVCVCVFVYVYICVCAIVAVRRGNGKLEHTILIATNQGK